MNDRRSYLIQQQALGLLSPAERNELATMDDIHWTDDGRPGMVLPPPLQGDTHDEKLADFARRFMFDDREATPEECEAFVSGKAVGTAQNQQSPVDEPDQWADDAEPPAPVTSPVVPSAEPTLSAPTPPAPDDKLKDILQVIGDDLIEIHDASYPHDPPKLIRRSVWEKQQRKQRMNAASAIRRGPGGNKVSF